MPDTHAAFEPDSPHDTPALWRPSAVAAWSLLFTPVFGSWLLMHNWRVLGQAHAARSARHWLLASVLVLALEGMAGAITARVNGTVPFSQWLALAWLGLWLLGAAAPLRPALRAARLERRAGRGRGLGADVLDGWGHADQPTVGVHLNARCRVDGSAVHASCQHKNCCSA